MQRRQLICAAESRCSRKLNSAKLTGLVKELFFFFKGKTLARLDMGEIIRHYSPWINTSRQVEPNVDVVSGVCNSCLSVCHDARGMHRIHNPLPDHPQHMICSQRKLCHTEHHHLIEMTIFVFCASCRGKSTSSRFKIIQRRYLGS